MIFTIRCWNIYLQKLSIHSWVFWMIYGLLATFLLAGASHMWCLYQTRKRQDKPYKLPSYCSYQLCLQDHGMHDQQQTRVIPGKKQNYHTCTVWFLQRSKYHRPPCTFRVFCQRGFYSEAARYCYSIWSRKGLWYDMEVWHFKRFTWCCSAGPTATFHSRLPLWQEVPSQSWRMLLQTLWTGNGCTSRKHLICYTILSEN